MKKNVVTIGGGTGSFTILSGLKKFDDFNISAIVSMADDGGSTGRLRDELGVLPPGDVRQCLVALSEEPKEVRELFNYRFESGQLRGHTVGNIVLSALEKKKGSFSRGLAVAMDIFNIKGRVIPVTDDNVELVMQMKNGHILKGESDINHAYSIQKDGLEQICLKPCARINPDAKRAILAADIVVIGPGNHYCSIVPNLLVKGVADALKQTKAKIIYVANLVNKKGHTNGFTLDDYVESINGFVGADRIDFVIFNTQKPNKRLEKKYQRKGEDPVGFEELDKKRKFKIITAKLLGNEMVYPKSDAILNMRSLIRHDSNKLAKLVKYVSELDEYVRIIKKVY